MNILKIGLFLVGNFRNVTEAETEPIPSLLEDPVEITKSVHVRSFASSSLLV